MLRRAAVTVGRPAEPLIVPKTLLNWRRFAGFHGILTDKAFQVILFSNVFGIFQNVIKDVIGRALSGQSQHPVRVPP